MHGSFFRRHRDNFKPGRIVSAVGMSLLLLVGQTAPLLGNPTGGAVVAGSATIGAAGATLTINQSTQNAIINWQQFSIASGEATKFIVPNSGATLNRVTGGNPSAIYGTLQSNGTLYLVNPSGIVVGPSGRIDTAGFLASTLDVSNEQFLSGGDMEFAGGSNASITNSGTIHASSGDVYLIANQVNNKGTLSAPQGTVGLAAGSDILFQQAGNEHLFVQATPAGTQRATGVTNSGTIRAAAAELRAAGGNAYALAINNTGVIAATGYKKINGQVYLTSDGGSISNSGRISAQQANGNGGTIVVDGTAKKSAASGAVTNSGTLDASATLAGGTGGSVTLKNMGGKTVHSGTILAKGGQGGTGGTVEVSGKSVQLSGSVNTSAAGGKTGTLFIDPATFTVAASGGDETGAAVSLALASNNVTLNADNTVTIADNITWTTGNTLTLSTNDTGSTINIYAPITGTNGTLTINTAGASDVISSVSGGAIDVSSFLLQNGYWNQVQTGSETLPSFTASHDFEVQGSSTFLRATGGGDGTTNNPYLISDVYGLQGIGSPSNNLLGDDFALTSNIDATATTSWNSGAGFSPIGTYTGNSGGVNVFNGIFNGQGYSINGITVNLPDSEYAGLFGDSGTTSILENLSLTNVNITGDAYAGGLCGVCNSDIQNVYVSGNVTGSIYVGGLAGITSNAISNSYSIATVTGSAGFGGLVGEEQFGSITDCYSSGVVSSGGGGLVGYGGGTVTDSFWDTTTSGASTSAGGTGESTANLLMESTYTSAGWNIGNTLSDTWVIFDGQTRPILSTEYSTTITNAHQLQLIGLNPTTLGATYTIASNVDLSGDSNPADVWGTSLSNSGAGFVPIGNSTNSFTGSLNGQSYALNGLYTVIQIAGLFGQTAGTITGVDLTGGEVEGGSSAGGLAGINTGTITDSSYAGSVSGGAEIGGLVGDNSSVVTGSHSSGTVTGGESYIGGLVGINEGTISTDYSTSAVTGGNSATEIGGLVGRNQGGGVSTSYATGAVTGYDLVGGLVGQNDFSGSIINTYATGAVTGTLNVGGLVGDNEVSIYNSYSTGLVTGTSGAGSNDVGGIVGFENVGQGASLNNTFWDTDTSGTTLGVGSGAVAGATAATTAQLESETFINAHSPNSPMWDFTNVWTTDGGTLTPQLIGLPTTPLPTGGSSGSSATTDTLSGTAFTDSGTTADAPGLIINLIFDGSVLGSTTTDSSGDFTFSVSSTDLTGGVLLTDAHSEGNTYYQANSPAASITGVDLWGDTVRVIADTASNAALGQAAGNLTGSSGVIYGVSNGNLGTVIGDNVDIVSHYTLDGNVTASNSGTITTESGAVLDGSANVTLTGSSVAMAGTFNRTGSLTVTATNTDVTLTNVGTAGTPATAAGITLNAPGSVVVTNSFVATNGGNFSASNTGASTILNGVTITDSSISTGAGTLFISGLAAYENIPDSDSLRQFNDVAHSDDIPDSDSNVAGLGVDIVDSTMATTSGNMTIMGDGSVGAGVTVTNSLTGVVISGSTLSVATGAIAITGTVATGTADSYSDGVIVNNASTVEATSTGSISIIGNASGSLASTYTNGVNDVGATISAVDASGTSVSGIYINGTAGGLTNQAEDANSVGVSVYGGSTITATGSAPITLVGTGGDDTESNVDGYSGGILLSAGSSGMVSSISSTTGAISLTGTGGVNPEFTSGINIFGVDPNSATITSTSGAITLNGSLTAENDPSLYPQAIVLQTGASITTQTGAISMTGTATGTSADIGTATLASGVIVREGAIVDASAGGSILITGATAGALTNADNYAVELDDAQISTNGGALTIHGTAGDATGSTDAEGILVSDTSTLSAVDAPITLTGTVTQGTSASGGFITGVQLNDSTISATGTASVAITGNASGSTGSGEDLGVYTYGAGITAANASGLAVSGINLTGTAGGLANETVNAGAAGLYIYTGSTIDASGTAPITLMGTGGTDTATDPSINAFSSGIFLASETEGVTTSVTAATGALSLTGIGGVSPRFSVGLDLYGTNGGTALVSSTSGAVNLNGSVTSVPNPSMGIFGLYVQTGAQVTTQDGAITIDGMVPSGDADVGATAQADAVVLSDTAVTATGLGSISITGDSTGAAGSYQIGGLLVVGSTVSSVGGNLTLDGVDSTSSTVSDELFGLVVRGASTILAQDGSVSLMGTVSSGTADARDFGVRVSEGSTVTADGTGGNITLTGSTVGSVSQGIDTGVVVEGVGSTVTAEGSAGLAVTGNSGTLTGTTGAILDVGGDNVYYNPGTYGILVSDGGSLQTIESGSMTPQGPMTLTGTSGTDTNTDPTSSSSAVAIFSPVSSETTSLSAAGSISLFGPGLAIGGANNVGTISIASPSGVLLSSSGAATSTVDAPINAPLSLGGGNFVLDLFNSINLGLVSVDNLTIQAGGFGVNLGATTAAALTINGAGAVTQGGALTTSLLTVANATAITLTNAANDIGALGNVSSTGAIDIFTDPGLTLTGMVTSPAPITIAETGGNLTFGSGGQVVETGSGNIILAAGTDLANSRYIVNDSTAGANAIQPGEGNSYFLYSSDPTYDNLGGLMIAPANLVYNAVYPTSSNNFTGNGNASFFYVGGSGDVGPNAPNNTSDNTPSTGSGSNIVPPAITPQASDVAQQNNPSASGGDSSGNGSQPPFSYQGNGMSQILGQLDGGLANSASNSGQVSSGDIAQVGDGQMNNVANPEAADALNEALGPIVYQNLADALRAEGDWADVPDQTVDTVGNGEGETILSGGDVAEMSGSKVTNIPLSQAPEQLRNAMKGDLLKGVGSGH
jgi:filamentous hemagglutinin family protein